MVSDDDRASLRDDLRRALDQLGPGLTLHAQPILAVLRQDLGRLPRLLTEPDGALVARGVVEAALSALADAEMCVHAWRDARAAFESGAWAGECELRVLQLRELVTLRGLDWRATARSAGGILMDDPVSLSRAGLAVDAEDLKETTQRAGVALDERLAGAEAVLRRDPAAGEVVGWTGFSNAEIRAGYLEVAGVEFFASTAWPERVRDGWPAGEPRAEFLDANYTMLFSWLPNPPFVLVRVPLGNVALSDAVNRTRAVSHDLVRAAQPHSEWSLLDGAALYVNGERPGWFGAPIRDRQKPPVNRYSPEFEPTANGLSVLDGRVVSALIEGSEEAHAAVRDIEWVEAVAKVPEPAQRLALGLRLVERCLPAPRGTRWTAAVSRYLKKRWCDERSRDLIADAATGACELLDGPVPVIGRREPWRERLTPHSPDLSYGIRLDETIRAAPELLEALDKGAMQTRVVAELSQRAETASTWLDFLREQGERFDILLARAARQRNAVIHGADTVPDALSSVSGFVASLQSMLTQQQLVAVHGGKGLLALLEEHNLRLDARRRQLTDGVPVLEAIFDHVGSK